jgi:spore germination cell wall hydrolase CwlJ-like protein
MRQNMKNLISSILTATLMMGTVSVPFIVEAQAQSEANQAQIEAEFQCLALNIYYEARGSNLADKAAVADVVLNRTQDRRYPASICEVVQQGNKDANGNMIRNQCQFSWYCDGKSDNPQDLDRWNEAQVIAYNMLTRGKYRGITEGATHYHATYVNPRWASTLQTVGRIGAHIYYRWEE